MVALSRLTNKCVVRPIPRLNTSVLGTGRNDRRISYINMEEIHVPLPLRDEHFKIREKARSVRAEGPFLVVHVNMPSTTVCSTKEVPGGPTHHLHEYSTHVEENAKFSGHGNLFGYRRKDNARIWMDGRLIFAGPNGRNIMRRMTLVTLFFDATGGGGEGGRSRGCLVCC